MSAIRWRYVNWRRDKSLHTIITEHLLRLPHATEVRAIRTFQAVTYAAVAFANNTTAGFVCPLDLSGEYGRYRIGFAVVEETVLGAEAPDHWARAPAEVLGELSPTDSTIAGEWRDRCCAYLRARAALGALRKGVVVRLARGFPAGQYASLLLECTDGRSGHYRALDLPGHPPVAATREALIQHGGQVVTKGDHESHKEMLFQMEDAA